MRILHVTTTADLKSGGPIESIRQRGLYLEQMGHSVEVLTADDPASEAIRDFPLTVHAQGPSEPTFARAPKMLDWLEANGAKYDALIGDGLWQYPNLALRQGALKLNKPYWVFTHGMLDPYFNRAFPLKRLKKNLYWPWQYPVLRDAQAVLFTCEEEKLLARESFRPYRVRERVVGFGTTSPAGDPETQKKAFDAAFPQLAGKRFLLFLSRIHPKKGPDLMLKAFSRFAQSQPDLHLVMAGPVSDDYRTELEGLIKGDPSLARIHWLGMIKDDVKFGSFRNAEAFVLPSHQENFGIAVAEALACGIPVLITRPVNIWREIEADGAGIVGEDTDPGIDAVLKRWADLTQEEREKMGAAASRCFQTRFTIKHSAESLLEAIEEGLTDGTK